MGSFDLGKRQRPALGVSVAYLNLNGIEARTGNTASPDRTFGASDFYAAFSFSRPVSRREGFSSNIGITAKLIQQKIDNRKAESYAMDLGLLQQIGSYRLGLALTNVGPNMRFISESYPLPQTLRFGISHEMAKRPMTVALGFEKLRGEKALSYRIGSEYRLGSLMSLRMGYLMRQGTAQKALKGSTLGSVSNGELGGLTGFVGGMGFRFFGYGLDYAFSPYGELGNTHRLSLTARFSKTGLWTQD